MQYDNGYNTYHRLTQQRNNGPDISSVTFGQVVEGHGHHFPWEVRKIRFWCTVAAIVTET